MDPITKDVQGVAMYAEFVRATGSTSATLMMLLTPDGYNEDGRQVNATLYRRVTTDYAPKRQWRASALNTIDLARPLPKGDTFRRNRLAEERFVIAKTLLEQIVSQGWSLTKEPVFVEVSKRDLADIEKRKTPSKVLYRVLQSRKALGFPEPSVAVA